MPLELLAEGPKQPPRPYRYPYRSDIQWYVVGQNGRSWWRQRSTFSLDTGYLDARHQGLCGSGVPDVNKNSQVVLPGFRARLAPSLLSSVLSGSEGHFARS